MVLSLAFLFPYINSTTRTLRNNPSTIKSGAIEVKLDIILHAKTVKIANLLLEDLTSAINVDMEKKLMEFFQLIQQLLTAILNNREIAIFVHLVFILYLSQIAASLAQLKVVLIVILLYAIIVNKGNN